MEKTEASKIMRIVCIMMINRNRFQTLLQVALSPPFQAQLCIFFQQGESFPCTTQPYSSSPASNRRYNTPFLKTLYNSAVADRFSSLQT